MADISAYPNIQPKIQDLVVGSETYVAGVAEVTGNPTRNFTVGAIVDLANKATAVSFRLNANWSKGVGAVSPSFTATMLNTFSNVTFTLSRTATGTYFITASSPIFTNNKTQCIATPGSSGGDSPDFFTVAYTSTQSIGIQQVNNANALSDQAWANGVINIEVFV